MQCPQFATAPVSHTALITDDGTNQILATSNVLRTNLLLRGRPWPAGATNGIIFPDPPSGGGQGQYVSAATDIDINAANWGTMVSAEWLAAIGGNGLSSVRYDVFESIIGCEAIILGISQAVPTNTGPNGVLPFGIWQSSDLSSGGSQFRLSWTADNDLVTQEWFAWPVGNAPISIQVFQAFDMPPATEDLTTFTARLPQLDTAGKRHLETLRERIRQAEAAKAPTPVQEQ